jgi:hypothetical protein
MRWYKSNYGDVVKMKNWNTFNLDLVNLGSSSVRYGLNYSGLKLSAANWAMAPQNIASDFAILKNYHSYIKQNGLLLLLICPFSGLVVDYPNKAFYDKYHYFLHPILVKHFNEYTLKKISNKIEYPLPFESKALLKAIIKKILGRDNPKYPTAQVDAQNRIDGWKKEFGIIDFSDTLSSENLKAIEFNTNLLCEMIDFCKERNLRPVIGIMPTTKTLKDKIPQDLIQKAFYSMVGKVKESTGVQFFDYYRSSEFESEDLYLDSFLLNEKGAKLFTQKVLADLGLI